MEEKKITEVPAWTEEQWEKWIYSFATELEFGKAPDLTTAGDPPEIRG
jgi:hypothetical protein